MITIETPAMGQGSAKEQLQQIQSYLYRTAQQLQWAFTALEGGSSGGTGEKITETRPTQEKTPEQTFSEIRNLIVKSAVIVDAYSQEITKRLEGTYVAQSEFGDYREKTAQEIKADSQSIQQLFTSTQTMGKTLEDLYSKTLSSSAYIRTGRLTEGEHPAYGLEIGQRNTVDGVETFDKFARFTADRLSFFDRSDVEVAYISDYKLYITNAQVTGTLEIGSRFKVFFDGGLAFQWTGGNSTWQAAL